MNETLIVTLFAWIIFFYILLTQLHREIHNCGHTIKRPTYSILFGKFLVGMGTNFGVPVRNNRKTDNQWTNLLYLWLKEKKSWYQTEKYNLDTAKLKESASGVLEFWTSDVFCLWLLLLLPVRPFNTMGLFYFLKLNTYFQKYSRLRY